MRSLLSLALGALMVLVLGAGTVLAAKPEHIKETGTFQLPPAYCGLGVTLDVAFKSTRNLFWDGDWLKKSTNQTTYVISTAGNDNVVTRRQAGSGTSVVVPEANGGYAIVNTGRGQAEQIKGQHGGVLLRDAGDLVITDHFDAADNYLGSDVSIRGPHPDFESDFTAQCAAMKEGLGL